MNKQRTIYSTNMGVVLDTAERVFHQPRRGRKLSDVKQKKINNAVREVIDRRKCGEIVSVREVAEKFQVSKSTLHRYIKQETFKPSQRRRVPLNPKHSIQFLVGLDNAKQDGKLVNVNGKVAPSPSSSQLEAKVKTEASRVQELDMEPRKEQSSNIA